MDERERMLAEGPRVAPEPVVAADSGSGFEVPEPAAESESDFGFEAPKPVVTPPTQRTGRSARPAQLPLLRLIPLAGFGLFVLVSAAGYRRYAFVFLAAGLLLSMVLRGRRRGKL